MEMGYWNLVLEKGIVFWGAKSIGLLKKDKYTDPSVHIYFWVTLSTKNIFGIRNNGT